MPDASQPNPTMFTEAQTLFQNNYLLDVKQCIGLFAKQNPGVNLINIL
jgi:hypothetical protein